MSNDLLTTEQAAQYLDLKRNTLEIWRTRGGGPLFVKIGRNVRYRKADLDAFVERNLLTSTSQANAER